MQGHLLRCPTYHRYTHSSHMSNTSHQPHMTDTCHSINMESTENVKIDMLSNTVMVRGEEIRDCNNHTLNEFNPYMLHMNTKQLLTVDCLLSPHRAQLNRTRWITHHPSVGMKRVCSKQTNHARSHTRCAKEIICVKYACPR